MCSYISSASPFNMSHMIERFDHAKCGLNKVGYKFCNVRKGDAQYVNFMDMARKVVSSNLECHSSSHTFTNFFPKKMYEWPCKAL